MKLKGRGLFELECWNEDGTLAWREVFPNGSTNIGINNILDVYFAAGSQSTLWYLGLIDNTSFTGLASTDTIASHSGWIESTAYSQSVRQTWTPSAASGQSITNPVAATFTANAGVTVKGAFLVSNSTKGGSSGTLWATGTFPTNQVLASGQSLTLKYTYSLS